MKELITTQLIEEYQKESIKSLLLKSKSEIINDFISRLQSKQSEERQNIVDAVTDTIENTSYQKDGDGYIHCEFDGEDYFNQTFKQEQKVIDANGKEKGK